MDAAEAARLYHQIFIQESYGFPYAEPKVIVDVGANIGLASMFFHQRFPAAAIIAVEPAPDPYQALEWNLANHVPAGVARNVAVSAYDGTARLGYYPRASSMSGLYVDPAGDIALTREFLVRGGFSEPDADHVARSRHELRFLDCRAVTLSTLLRETAIEQVDLLKIDVERGELDVLHGIEENDWSKIGELVIEVHDIADRLTTVRTLLEGRGFSVSSSQDRRLAGTEVHLMFASQT